MSKFWSTVVHDLTPYVPGEQPQHAHVIKLNTNENPYGPSPRAIAAIAAAADDRMRLYPDPESTGLRQAFADMHGLGLDQVFVGNGSDEVLAHLFHALFKHDAPILFPDVTYSFYPVYCALYEIEYAKVALTENLEIDHHAFAQTNGGIIFANPNAPTGCALDLDAIEALLRAQGDSVVVIDEAYIAFGADTAVPLIERYDNLVVVQTLSKSHGLAGLRVGAAFAHPELIEGLQRVKNSFNSYPLDRLAQAGASEALADTAYYEQTRRKVMASREWLRDELAKLGFAILPSQANFLFATHSHRSAIDLARDLREKNIIVRHFDHERTSAYLRITIGTEDELVALVAALVEILKS